MRGRDSSLELVACLICGGLGLLAAAEKSGGKPNAPLGSPDYCPSAVRPVGWRGDGNGRYPGADPPVNWERKRNGNGYTTKNIIWAAHLPSTGVSCPIIVGNRVFLTTEVHDLVCVEKQSGQILWIRSNPEFEGLSDEERKGNPIFSEKLAPLLPQLAKANEDVAKLLNAEQAKAAASSQRPNLPVKKREIEKQISDGQLAVDKKKFERYWAQGVFGFAGPTVVSDGTHVCAFFTTGVSACYDLDGNRKWIQRGSGGGSEHGNFASPILCENKLVVWANEMRAYDVESGKLLWSNPAKASNTYGSMFRLRVGDEWVAAFQCGFFARLRDGKAIWGENIFGDAVDTPIVEGAMLYASMGYPRANDKTKGLHAFKIPDRTDGSKLASSVVFKTDWAADEIPEDKQKPFERSYCASPLFVDGLIYRMTQAGGLVVNDAASGEVVYRKVLPLRPKTEYWNWAGASASPTLAGKHIYLMDNQGKAVIMEPGRQYKEVAVNVLEDVSKNGKEQTQCVSTPVFEGTRMYYRTPNYLYCIGEK
jgi:outer membrane protein assembly factor BamB